jgi:hypothetical protein
LDEGIAYIEMSLDPEIQRIMLLDGPAVLGDPSRWPNQTACLRTTTETIQALIDEGTVKPVDAEAAARLINGAALNAALWIAAADDPRAVLGRRWRRFRQLAVACCGGGANVTAAHRTLNQTSSIGFRHASWRILLRPVLPGRKG